MKKIKNSQPQKKFTGSYKKKSVKQPDNKICSLNKCKKRNILLLNHAENEAGRLVSELFLFFQKKLYLR